MIKNLIFRSLFLFLCHSVFSQNADVKPFVKLFSSSESQKIIDIIEDDTTLVLLGISTYNNVPIIEIIRTNRNGDVLNISQIKDAGASLNPFQLIKNSEGELIVLAEKEYVDHSYTMIFTLGNNDNVLDEFQYGTDSTYQRMTFIQENNSNYYLGGTLSGPWMSFGNDFWILKLKQDGSIIWDTYFGIDTVNEVASSLQIVDDKIYVFGDKNKPSFEYNPYMIKMDTAGNYISDTPLNWMYNGGVKMSCIGDEHIYVTGESSTSAGLYFDIYLDKYDFNGDRVWRKLLPGTNKSETGFDIKYKNGNLFIGGYAYDTIGATTDLHYTITDTSGKILTQKLYDVGNVDIGYQILLPSFGGIYVAGFGQTLSKPDYLLIYDTTYYSQNTLLLENNISDNKIVIIPNPSTQNQKLLIPETSSIKTINIYNGGGKLIKSIRITNAKEINLNILEKGIYFVHCIGEKLNFTQKLIHY